MSSGGLADIYTNLLIDNVDISSSILAFAAEHYFSHSIGEGLFARGDIGLARTSVRILQVFSSTNVSRSEVGLGLRLGGGYSIPISSETRLPLALQWQYAGTGNGSGSHAFMFTAGFLF